MHKTVFKEEIRDYNWGIIQSYPVKAFGFIIIDDTVSQMCVNQHWAEDWRVW